MRYLPEFDYFDDPSFPALVTIKATAKAVSPFCNYYVAEIFTATDTNHATKRTGKLPNTNLDQFIDEIFAWIETESIFNTSLFKLILDTKPINTSTGDVIFAYHDDLGSLSLVLNEKQFTQIQKIWKKQNLPPDLFYPETEGSLLPVQGHSLRKTIGRLLGFKQYYTPRKLLKVD